MTLSLTEIWRMISLGLETATDDTTYKNLGVTTVRQYTIGDGGLIVALGESGNIICVWDGRYHVDIHVFTFDEGIGFAEKFADRFVEESPRGSLLRLALQDDQPRGINGVINFPSDIMLRTATTTSMVVEEAKEEL
jgi:hypothetical protein